MKFWYIIFTATLISAAAYAAFGQMACDSNNDGKVSVSELVQGVNNALDPCHEGCSADCFEDNGNCPCPTTCREFPTIDGVRCAVDFCFDSEVQVRACFNRFRAAHPDRCNPVGQ